MSALDPWLVLLGGLVLLLGLGAGVVASRSYLPSEPILAVGLGIVVGPRGFGVLRLSSLGDPLALLEPVAEFTVALAVMSIALRLPPAYVRERARSLATLLGPGMVTMWLASALVAYLVLPVDPLVALLLGAVVTPTDPVLANSIVVGGTAERNVPVRLRYLLSGEAGINDGAAYPFVFLPILAMARPLDAALSRWLLHSVLLGVLGAVAVGFAAGAAVGRIERWENSRNFLEESSLLTITVALTFAVLGLANLLGAVGILAVVVAGIAYNWQADPGDEADEQRVQEVLNRLFTYPVFVLFGMAIPWRGWAALGWRGPALVAGILLLRRLPMIFALRRFVTPLDRPEASAFVGWFGPIGIAAVFYALLAAAETGLEVAWIAGSLVVAGSILVHGLTATVATYWYGGLGDVDEGW